MKITDHQYIYIVQASKETSFCKIGITKDLEERLKTYNNRTGKSKDNIYQYLFACEVEDMTHVENDIKKEFSRLREVKNKEVYFYNSDLFEDYVNFIKSHKLFIKEIFVKKDEPKQITKIKIVKKTTPTLEDRGITPIDVMHKAKKAKNDEFYTRYEDIEKELTIYDKEIWKDKVVFCNCDDAVGDDERNTSAFSLYFLRNFKELELQKLICTHYGGGLDIFNQGGKGYIFTKKGYKEIGKKEYPKGFTGSFDDPISLKILNEEADIVCTNPPFSRSRDFWKIIIKSGKKFLILSNHSILMNKTYILYLMKEQARPGYNRVDWFLNPKKVEVDAPGYWFTNFPIKDRPRYNNLKIIPLKEIPEKYIKYDDTKILLVDNNYIPNDYKKPFAVSVYPILSGILEKGYKIIQDIEHYPYINGKKKFARVLIQKEV